MPGTRHTKRAAQPCGACGQALLTPIDVKGRRFAFRDEPALKMPDHLVMHVCQNCGEIRESASQSRALDLALQRCYAELHRSLATDAVSRLVNAGWQQSEIEQVMAVSAGYLSKALRGERVLAGATLRHLIHVANHPREALDDLAPHYPHLGALAISLKKRGALTAA
jgi:hypothetical protein